MSGQAPDYLEPLLGAARGAEPQDARSQPRVRLNRPIDTPDFIEPIVGWRVWRVAAERGRVVLVSAVRDDVWEPRRAFEARCPNHERAPAAQCGCGVHALRKREGTTRYAVGRTDTWIVGRVVGLVSLWGSVVECEHGWRAEHAYPAQLWLPEELRALGPALEQYGVPIERLAPPASAHKRADTTPKEVTWPTIRARTFPTSSRNGSTT